MVWSFKGREEKGAQLSSWVSWLSTAWDALLALSEGSVGGECDRACS